MNLDKLMLERETIDSMVLGMPFGGVEPQENRALRDALRRGETPGEHGGAKRSLSP